MLCCMYCVADGELQCFGTGRNAVADVANADVIGVICDGFVFVPDTDDPMP